MFNKFFGSLRLTKIFIFLCVEIFLMKYTIEISYGRNSVLL